MTKTLFTIDSTDKTVVRVSKHNINRPDIQQYNTLNDVVIKNQPDIFVLWLTDIEDLTAFNNSYIKKNVRHIFVDLSSYDFITTQIAESYFRNIPNFIVTESIENSFILKNKIYLDSKLDASGSWTLDDVSEHEFDESLASCIRKFCINTNITGVVDLGCGPGEYVKYLTMGGIKCVGYDGNPNTFELTKNTIAKCDVLDLSKPVNLMKVDCVLSLEVGEHIPLEYEQTFIDNLCNHANRFIILSWGISDQDGYGHVNCHTNEYVREQMANRGFASMTFVEEQLRNAASFSWFKNTIMVFTKQK